jgi:hypothetical protein
MAPCSNCDKQFPYNGCYQGAMQALKELTETEVYVNWMLAVAVKESSCNAYFSRRDQLLVNNLVAMPLGGAEQRNKWLDFITVREGAFKNQIPKFRFEPAWERELHIRGARTLYPEMEFFVHCCSWGMTQKSGLYYLDGFPKAIQLEAWKQFVQDPLAQLKVLAKDLKNLHRESKGSLELMFTRYNSGSSAQEISKYGTITADMSQGFAHALQKEGLPLCLVSTR